MSSVKFLEKLLDGVAVEWVSLGSVSKIGTGSSNRQDESETGEYPFYVRSQNILKSDTFEFDEEAIIIPGEGGIGDIFHYVKGKYALHQRAYRISISSSGLNAKFVYRMMQSSFKQYILMKSVGATSISIRKPMLEGFLIPIPCPENPEKSLEIQAEIVRILDAMTAHTAELTAELTARKKQYNYYRDKLLSFEGSEVEWKTLNKIYQFSSGLSKSADQFGFGSPFLSYKSVFNNIDVPNELETLVNTSATEQDRFSIKKGDVFITRTSESLDELGMSCAATKDYPKATFNGFTKRLRPNVLLEIDPKFSA